MKTTLYYAELSALHDENLFRQYYLALPACRKEKIDRIKPEGERRRSLGAGLLLKKACEEYGIPGEDGYLLIGEYGKPAFAARPDVHFSLSHSGEYAACVVAGCEAGCDIETVKPFRWPVAKRVFAEEECRWLSSEEEQGRGDEAFCRLWTLKESFLKATGKGFSFPVQELSFSLTEKQPAMRLYRQPEQAFTFYELRLAPECCCALCLHSVEEVKPAIIQISL